MGAAVPVTLTHSEILHGAIAGVFRQAENLRLRRVERFGVMIRDGFYTHCNGALAELAVAKVLGRYWSGLGALNNLAAPDVLGVQVRWTPEDEYRLPIHKSDKPGDVFVLVTGRAPTLTVHGWIHARDGQHPEYWDDPTGRNFWAYFVPQSALRPMAELPRREGA